MRLFTSRKGKKLLLRNKQKLVPVTNLKSRAESILKKKSRSLDDDSQLSIEQLQTLAHKLQVLQVELELQNQELLETQLQLTQSRDAFIDLYDFAPVGYLTINDKGTIVQANLTVAKMLGVDRVTLSGRTLSSFISPEDKDKYYLNMSRLNQNPVKTTWELRLSGVDATAPEVAFTAAPILDTNGNFQHLFWIVISDLSEIRRPELPLTGILPGFESLERSEVASSSLQKEKFESLNNMAGSIAHNFNNQLTGVIGYLELAMISESLDSETRFYLMKAMKAARQSVRLAEQMLIYSGSNTYIPEPINLRELLRKNRDQFERIVSRNIKLDIHLSGKLPTIKGNPDHILRLIKNILTNSSEALGNMDGHIALHTGTTDCNEAELEQSHLHDKPAPGKFVFLEISDTGPGMDADAMRKLFDPFFTTKFVGRGLGMPEVMGIVRGHKGALFAESRPGKGTTIRVLLPVPGNNQNHRE